MTHRMFSRNASSSRAIPVSKMIADIRRDPAGPVHWGKNQPGMQARAELEGDDIEDAKAVWIDAWDSAISYAEELHAIGAHKQIVNRLLEPFMHISVVVTATEWANFFHLRLHPDAQPEIQALAQAMKAAMDGNCPTQIADHDWHLPYVDAADRKDVSNNVAALKAISAARCARVSYLNHDGEKPELDKDLTLARQLWESGHLSPFEHQAKPEEGVTYNLFGWASARWFMENPDD
jgi:thymidylate synthase ThyX